MRRNCTKSAQNLQTWHFSEGGERNFMDKRFCGHIRGGERNFMDKRFCGHLPPPPPIFAKNMGGNHLGPYVCRKSLKIEGFIQKMWHTDLEIWHTNTPPPGMPYEPFLLGWGWSSICWFNSLKPLKGKRVLSEHEQLCRCLESRFALRSDSKRHRFATISNHTIRIARPKTVRIAVNSVKALLSSLF